MIRYGSKSVLAVLAAWVTLGVKFYQKSLFNRSLSGVEGGGAGRANSCLVVPAGGDGGYSKTGDGEICPLSSIPYYNFNNFL